MTWTNIIHNAGTLIPTPSSSAITKRYLFNDGQHYSMTELLRDPRNTENLALSTLHDRLAGGCRDIEHIFKRRASRPPPKKPSAASERNFVKKGIPL